MYSCLIFSVCFLFVSIFMRYNPINHFMYRSLITLDSLITALEVVFMLLKWVSLITLRWAHNKINWCVELKSSEMGLQITFFYISFEYQSHCKNLKFPGLEWVQTKPTHHLKKSFEENNHLEQVIQDCLSSTVGDNLWSA